MSKKERLAGLFSASFLWLNAIAITGSAAAASGFDSPNKTNVAYSHTALAATGITPICEDFDASPARTVVRVRHRPTIALALGGGGVRGAAHIGVLRVLKREGIPIDYIAGSSMGAVVGGMYAAGVPLDELERMFQDRSLFKAFTPVPVSIKLSELPIRAIIGTAKRAVQIKNGVPGLYSKNNLMTFVSKHLPSERQNVEETEIPFTAVATNLIDGKAYAFEKGSLGRAVQASSAIPLYVKPIAYNNMLLVDGALRANVPTGQARHSGADIVISVNVNENLQPFGNQRFNSIAQLTNRAASIMLDEVDAQHASLADLEIRPEIVSMPVYSRSVRDADRAIAAGEEAAERAIPQIRTLINGRLAMTEQ